MRKLSQKKLQTAFLATLALFILAFSVSAQSMFRKITDFDGDGKTDFAVTRSENNRMVWYLWQSSQGFKAFQWGLASDTPVAGDYDGDGKTDFAVCRQTFMAGYVNSFYIFQSQTNSLSTKTIISPGPISSFKHQDYDGDGKTDPAVHLTEGRGGFQIILRSTTNTTRVTTIPSTDFATKIGDMDGDGRADRTSYNPNTGLVTMTNLETNNSRTVQFGTANDFYLPADFDGDGIGDLTVWRITEGNWYWLRSSDNSFRAEHWGVSGDTPVPGDYDGDGKTDLAVYRRETPHGIYYVNGSQSGFQAFAWGISGDSPVSY